MAANPAFDRITVESGKCGGKPCIRGMRITVRRVLEILAVHPGREELFREYPFLEEEDLQQSLRYAAASVDEKQIELKGGAAGAPSGFPRPAAWHLQAAF